MLDKLHALLKEHNITCEIEWNTAKPTRDGSQWFIGKKWTVGEKVFYRGWFGDYKSGSRIEWSSEDNYTKDEKSEADRQLKSALELEKAELIVHQLKVSDEIALEFETFATTGTNAYLKRKQIDKLFGARIKDNPHGDPIVIVPMRDVNGKLWNYQRIYAQKLSAGDKFFVEGARIESCFHNLSERAMPGAEFTGTFYICEGYATACSTQFALGTTFDFVLSAFNAQNLLSVANALREKFNQARFVFCADNDAYTIIREKHVNVGINYARRAAGATKGSVVYPVFKYAKKGLTDYNDLHCAEGIDTVKDQILNFEKYVKGIQPMNLPATKSGAPKVPTEKEVCDYMLEFFKHRMIRQEKFLFKYNGTHWEEQSIVDIDRMKQMIGVAANGLLGSRELENYFRYLMIHMPTVPSGTDFYRPNPYTANFQNGTFHFYRNGDKKYHVDFRKHDPLDYLTNTLPFDCPDWKPGDPIPPAPLFDKMIQELWANNDDKEKIQSLAYELVGACLTPAFPTIVFFWGKPESGKSTFVKLITKLVPQELRCSVAPNEFNGFNMETMVGKLVNYRTEVDHRKPFNDDEVKMIIDREPRRIRRKGLKDIYGYIPAVHLFAGNRLPKTLEGSTNAYGRRLVLINTDSFDASKLGDKVVFDFEQFIIEEEMPQLLIRGLAGIYRLLENNGRYTIPEESRAAVRKIEKSDDVVTQFITDVRDGEIQTKTKSHLFCQDDAEALRSTVWEAFDDWQNTAIKSNSLQVGKHKFFDMLEERGFKAHRKNHGYVIKGMGYLTPETTIS